MNIKRILVPTDFSSASWKGIKFGVQLAREFDAKIVLLHSYPIPKPAGGMPLYASQHAAEELFPDITNKLKSFCQDINENYGVKAKPILKLGPPVREIVKAVEELEIDLIVMGTNGASGLRELLGSSTEAVIARAKCPIIAVPKNAEFEPIKKIVLAFDKLTDSENQGLKFLMDFAHYFKAELDVLHISKNLKKAERYDFVGSGFEEASLEDESVKFFQGINEDIEEGVNDFMHSQKGNMLALQYHEHGLLGRLFGKDTTRKFAYHSEVALLVFK